MSDSALKYIKNLHKDKIVGFLKLLIFKILNRSYLRIILLKLINLRLRNKNTNVLNISYVNNSFVSKHQDIIGPIYWSYPRPVWHIDNSYNDFIKNYCYHYKPSQGHTIIDVGAGIGEETIYFSKACGSSGRLISIEAHPETYNCLKTMIEQNNLFNSIPLNVALTHQSGNVMIKNHIHSINRSINTQNGIKVPSDTLDNILKIYNIKKIDFLKMNIEGAEKLAIKGMQETIFKIQVVCISCHDFIYERNSDLFFKTKDSVISFLLDNNFDIVHRESSQYPWLRDQVWATNPHLN